MRTGTLDPDPADTGRNSVPWLALLTFTQEELKVDGDILGTHQQNATMAVEDMSFGDLFALQDQSGSKVTSPYRATDVDPIDPTERPAFVFIPTETFRGLFSKYDAKGVRVDSNTPDTQRYKYLAHVRKINTEGLPSHLETDDEQRLFSLVVGHRTPPLDLTKTTSMSVHLVTIEGVEGVVRLNTSASHVALVSLHSWTYSCLPVGEMTLQDKMRHLGDNLNVLRPSDDVINRIGENVADPTLKERLQQRAREGYTVIRYRVQTGEETIAFTRSPFLPQAMPEPLLNLERESLSSGTDLQILDRELGIMDLTYCNAWQLGKTLALADRAFTSTLVRIRTDVGEETLKRAKLEMVQASGTYFTIEDTLKGLKSIVKTAAPVPFNPNGQFRSPPADASKRRWHRAPRKPLDLSFTNPELKDRLDAHCTNVVRLFASSTDGEDTPYAEHNEPLSADWMMVYKWILDRLFFYGIPAHYLVPDPEILPEETLRFFAIDKNWTDALIDGALSVANHQVPTMDQVTRRKLKEKIQEHLNQVDPALKYKPQVPTHGMLLRSEIVSQFPGLMIRAPKPEHYLGAPILRQEVIADGVLLCLFDYAPGTPTFFETLTIQMPPHEQRFSIAESITWSEIEVSIKKVFTDGTAPQDSYGELDRLKWTPGEEPTTEKPTIFDWEYRTLILPTWSATVMKTLKAKMDGHFTDDMATAALAGIQLNDPMYEMTIFDTSKAKAAHSLNPIATAFGGQSLRLATHGYDFSSAGRSVHLASSGGEAVEPDMNTRYKYGLWPVDSFSTATGTHWGDPFPIPNDKGYPINLLFSIVRKPDAAPRPLRGIELQISMLNDSGLMIKYEGPGGYMLSNMRWTLAIRENLPGERLLLSVIPRNVEDDENKGTSPIEYNKEISFVLEECWPNSKEVAYWNIDFKEVYEDDEEKNPGGAMFYKVQKSS